MNTINFNGHLEFHKVPGLKYTYVNVIGEVLQDSYQALSRWGTPRMCKRKILKGASDSMGYKHFRLLNEDGEVVLVKLHRMVLMTFSPHVLADELVVDHINGDKSDNRLCNLRWLTQSDNVKIYFKTCKAQGRKCYTDPLTEEQISLARELRAQGVSYMKIVARLGTSFRRVRVLF